jgi:hypothetical protein
MFTAIYLPSRPEGKEDPSRSGFATEEEAVEYVVSQMCTGCQEERRLALAKLPWPVEDGEEYAEDDFPPSAHPGCFYEWIIGPTEKVEAAEGFDQLMVACGWETIYRKDNTPEENAKLLADSQEKRNKKV